MLKGKIGRKRKRTIFPYHNIHWYEWRQFILELQRSTLSKKINLFLQSKGLYTDQDIDEFIQKHM